MDPFAYEPYHALFELYREAGEVDRAFCVASTLCARDKASVEERRYYEFRRPTELPMAKQRLAEDVFRRHVTHPDEDLYVSACFGIIAPAVAAWRAVDLSSTIERSERIDIRTDPSLLSRMCKYVQDVLHVVRPDLYLRPDDEGDFTWMNARRDGVVSPSLVVLRRLLQGRSEGYLAFMLARAMIQLYPPYFCIVALDRSHQAAKQVFRACHHALVDRAAEDVEALEAIAYEILGRMTVDAIEQLRGLLNKCGELDAKGWVKSTELTAYRAALAACGDMVTAGRALADEQPLLSACTQREKLAALLPYSVSEDYFAVRETLGLQIG